MKPTLLVLLLMLTVAGCRSRSLLADAKDVQVSRKAADKDCREIGTLTAQPPQPRVHKNKLSRISKKKRPIRAPTLYRSKSTRLTELRSPA